MNQASNASGTTHTTMTYLDDNRSSIGDGSIISNVCENGHSPKTVTRSISSQDSLSIQSSLDASSAAIAAAVAASASGQSKQISEIYNYEKQKFISYAHPRTDCCEDICIKMCRELGILPTTRTLFGLYIHKSDNEWVPPGKPLKSGVRYCFRIRFKVPVLDKQLRTLDSRAYEYLYWQMRNDMVNEDIAEIRYPAKKDSVMGLAVVDMYIDLLNERYQVEEIEANYKRYLPRPIVKAHRVFVRPKLLSSFRQFHERNIDLGNVIYNYIHQIHSLAPNYLLETFTAVVDFIPGDDSPVPTQATETRHGASKIQVLVKIDLYDTTDPGLKISRKLACDKLEWMMVSKLEKISALCVNGETCVSLEISDLRNAYKMEFKSKAVLESFITYVAGYIRLTSKWMLEVCSEYMTPSLQQLKALKCHGPIGGNYSFAIIREKNDKCGSYIIRQCEKEYDVYYIDINTKCIGLHPAKFRTETFKIRYDNSNNKWILHLNDNLFTSDNLVELVQYIPTDLPQKFRIPPSEFDKPPLLLICLPKNAQSKKYDAELSEFELQRARVLIFDRKTDLQVYRNSECDCDNGKMIKMRADWIQPRGSFKDVSVTLKTLKFEEDFQDFMKLAQSWSQIYSPHFIKLYGITISTPYTMIMAHCEKGPLDEFLKRNRNVSIRKLLDVVLGLVRGMVYMQEYNLVHGYLRCSNLYVSKFDLRTDVLEAKIADPGLPRSYTNADLPWIPMEHYNDLNAARTDNMADHWAFATTVWEIFSRGNPINIKSKEELNRNYNTYGGILPIPKDCPEEMYHTILDGWSREPNERFNHTKIFGELNYIKERIVPNYEAINGLNNDPSADASSDAAFTDTAEDMSTFSNGNSLEELGYNFSSNSSINDQVPLLPSMPLSLSNCFSNSHRSFFQDTPWVLQLNNGKVICNQKIGEGHYGTVYLGEMQCNMKSEKVAVKTLKKHFSVKQLDKDFRREIQIMQSLNHPNVVKIKQWIENPLSIIMEYIECGSFIVYLSSRKPNLTDQKLLRFAMDIAQGMNYLRNQNVIHRDLAARNILVDRDTAKISDFGLAQIANSDGYYYARSVREIPIKWYSPESIKTSKFSFQSDVWSYGVTLFEMFSRGETPNLDPERELTQDEFLNSLENGDRLRKPSLCPDIVYEKLMRPCWHANPKKRPSFEELIKQIDSTMTEYGEST